MSKLKNFKSYIHEQITLDEYFVQYYNFPEGTFSTLTHKDVKKIMPLVKRKKSEEITKENILTGEIILVKDNKGIVLGYQNPFIDNNIEEVMEAQRENNNVHLIISVPDDVDELEEIKPEDLSIYELEQLLKVSKSHKEYKKARLVQKELFFRQETHDDTKRKKETRTRRKEERMIEDDQY